MGVIRGQTEYRRFKAGEKLTRKQAMLALCFECNGQEDSRCNCLGVSCPLYGYHPYREYPPEVDKKAVSGS